MSEADKRLDTASLNLYQKLAKITGELGAIKKDGRSSGYGDHYTFIEYGAIAARIRELFAKYGVVIVPYMKEGARKPITSSKGNAGTHAIIPFVFVVRNADKPDDKFSVTWYGEAIDYGDKSTNKAATAALKYYLMRQFNISEQGDDPDHDSPPPPKILEGKQPTEPEPSPTGPPASDNRVTLKQLGALFAMMKEKGVQDRDTAKSVLHAIGGVESLTTLTKDEASSLIDAVHDMSEKDIDTFVQTIAAEHLREDAA